MDFLSLARARYSCRAYRPESVDDAALARALEAMRMAPSACNRQPYHLYVLETAKYREQLSGVYRHEWFVQAPLVVAMVALLDRSWCHRDGKNLGLIDAAIAFEHLLLAAAAEGLGSCWVAAFHRPNATQLLRLTGNAEILAFSPLGYPADEAPPKQRERLDQLVTFGLP
jgi:nitroreductase